MIGYRVDVEEDSAGNMRGEIIVLRQRQHARHLERGIDHLDAGIIQVRGEPFGGDERIIGGGHGAKSLLSFRGTRSVNPESRDSGFASRPGMTREKLPLLLRLPLFDRAAGVAPGGETAAHMRDRKSVV